MNDDANQNDAPEEPIIKDPIYDIMGDEEAQVAFDRLMELADASEDEPTQQPKDQES